MNLRDEMTSAVDGAEIDLHHLTEVARTNGARLVLSRRLTMIGVPAAMALAIGLGVTTLPSGREAGADTTTTTDLQPGTTGSTRSVDLSDTEPATGPGAVAALRYAVEDIAAGTSTDFRSQGPYGADLNLTGGFAFTAKSTGVTSYLQVSILTSDDVPLGSRCGSMTVRCEEATLDDSSVLVSSDSARAANPGSLNRSVILYRTDGVQVQVSNDTGQDVLGHEHRTRLSEEPSFTFDQLSEIAQQPWWGTTLPSAFVDIGTSLAVAETDDFD